MQLTVEFTDVYDGEEHRREEHIDAPAPGLGEDLDQWAYAHVHPHTGDGNHTSGDAGYFAKIISCPDQSDLVGTEFEWGV